MPHKFYKHKLLLDEGLYPRNVLHRTNNRHNIKHIKLDLNKGGIKGEEAYKIARKQKRIIITLSDYAKLLNKPAPVLLNAAKRQTIPAFREKGVWKIGQGSVK